MELIVALCDTPIWLIHKFNVMATNRKRATELDLRVKILSSVYICSILISIYITISLVHVHK